MLCAPRSATSREQLSTSSQTSRSGKLSLSEPVRGETSRYKWYRHDTKGQGRTPRAHSARVVGRVGGSDQSAKSGTGSSSPLRPSSRWVLRVRAFTKRLRLERSYVSSRNPPAGTTPPGTTRASTGTSGRPFDSVEASGSTFGITRQRVPLLVSESSAGPEADPEFAEGCSKNSSSNEATCKLRAERFTR